ncbi:hypothetical protein OJF2_74150 [Aquisphaera giovannonii]|uniref:Uncharacterized protein n=1 Tax=Aquisphaera giovannonii TaxID=406548 RepID=A0A5B9WFF9_9BACT|nr:hypothetical protein OJF2_74150 [Aquisphaera giovannonii]
MNRRAADGPGGAGRAYFLVPFCAFLASALAL